MSAEYRAISSLHNWEHNPRTVTKEGIERLIKQIKKLGIYKPLIITEDGTVLGGNMRLKALEEMGEKNVWVSVVQAETEEKKIEYALSDNDRVGKYEGDQLANLIGNFPEVEWADFSVDLDSPILVEDLIKKYTQGEKEVKSLAEKFIIPPFSVFDTRQGYWQDRKRSWIALGIDSEEGRGKDILMGDIGEREHKYKRLKKYGGSTNITDAPPTPSYADIKMPTMAPGTSIFDPVLVEIINTWFNVKNGTVLDPFAGGSVRGIVAEKLGHKYIGIDLAKKQIEANKEQAQKIGVSPTWIVGDSNIELDKLQDTYDLVFSCPPYEDLEVYGDDPADLSNMELDDFNKIYESIIKKSVDHLKDDRFACFVVTEVRGDRGLYTGLVARTIKYFEQAGANFYNDIILVNVAGTLPIRVAKQFNSGRKVGKTHQNVLIFYKGDPNKIKENYGEIDLSGVEELISEQTMQS